MSPDSRTDAGDVLGARHRPWVGIAVGTDRVPGAEATAVRTTLLGTIRWASLASVTALAIDSTRLWNPAPFAAQVLVVLSVITVGATIAIRRPFPWLSIAGLALAIGAAALSEDPSRRANASTTIFVLTYFGVLLLERRRALVWIAACMGIWAIVVPLAEVPVHFGKYEINLRWFTLSQLGFSALALWWVWEREVRRTHERDRITAERERDRIDAIQEQERVRVSRDLLVRTHETVLNDIRYVLSTETFDRERLADQLRERAVQITSLPVLPTVESVTRSICDAEGMQCEFRVTGGRSDLSRRQAEAISAAIREVVRNGIRHAGASHATISVAAGRDELSIRLRHDRSRNLVPAASGIGRGLVITESLASIGGTADLHADGADLRIPRHESSDDESSIAISDVGRIGLSAVTAGNTVGGLPFAIALAASQHDARAIVAAIAVVLATALACAAAARRHLTGAGVVVAAVAAAAATWFASSAAQRCEWTEASVIIGTLAGFAATSAVVWAPTKRWWALGVLWAGAMVHLAVTLPASCPGTTGASLRAAVMPPAFLGLMSWSLYLTASRARRTQVLQRKQAADVAAASAVLDVSQQLQSSVDEASAIMRGVASGRPLDSHDRDRLRCLDGAIRAAIQVDPSLAGGVSLASREIVNHAVDAGVPLRVLTLRDSGDRRPVDPTIVERLARLAVASIEGTAVVQVLASPGEDLLLLTTSPAAVVRSGLETPTTYTIGPDEFSLDAPDDSDVAVAFLRRTLSPAP